MLQLQVILICLHSALLGCQEWPRQPQIVKTIHPDYSGFLHVFTRSLRHRNSSPSSKVRRNRYEDDQENYLLFQANPLVPAL
jgi:hypothetical protein